MNNNKAKVARVEKERKRANYHRIISVPWGERGITAVSIRNKGLRFMMIKLWRNCKEVW